jgi:DNA-binding response OmpR family regulator
MKKQIAGNEQQEVQQMKPVLIVEDETIVRESLRDWLKNEGYEVDIAGEGEEALDKIAQKQFGVVVLDLRLPGRDGLQVLKEATNQDPNLKGIVITAYPSIETAVEAMKIGAVDYMVKPFTPDALEKSIEAVLGPVQVQIKPDSTHPIAPTPAEPQPTEEITPVPVSKDEIPAHFEQGKTHFDAKRYPDALREFLSIINVAPGDVDARVWLQKTRSALAEPRTQDAQTGTEESTKVKECLWSKMGMVSYRICTNDYDCLTCEFDQTMQEKIASGDTAELDQALEKLKEKPGPQRLCRYALKGDVSSRLCSRLFQCTTCEFAQGMQEATEQKIAKLATRRDALKKKDEKTKV